MNPFKSRSFLFVVPRQQRFFLNTVSIRDNKYEILLVNIKHLYGNAITAGLEQF